jgi:hypothetical protein
VLLRETFSAFIRASSQYENESTAATADYDFLWALREATISVPQMTLERM